MKRKIVTIFVWLAFSIGAPGIQSLVPFGNLDWEDQSVGTRGEGGATPTDETLFPWPMHLYDEVHNSFTTAPAPENGDMLWFNFTGFRTFGSPAIADGMVFIGAGNATGDFMFAFHQDNGTLAWKFKTIQDVSGGYGLGLLLGLRGGALCLLFGQSV